MQRLSRVTPAMLDVLEVLVSAEGDPHGFAIAERAGRPTGSVYPILARLEEAGWLTSYWEDAHPQLGRPRRRFYSLRQDGLTAARVVLADRRTRAAAMSGPGLRAGTAPLGGIDVGSERFDGGVMQ